MTNILSNLEYIIGIITLLGGVIAVHEFGHFIMAKWAGARVDVFSIGFGPKLFSKQWGETEYTLSLIPLGGYVKIYGQDPEELINDTNPQPDRSFANKSLIARIGVFIGGPAFNYFLAILIFTAMIMIVGSPKMPPARATRIIFNSPAYQAGLRSGDEIKSINGMPTKNFEDVSKMIYENPEKKISLQISRNTKEQEVQVQLDKEASYTAHGEPISIGVLNGLDVFGRKTFYASSDVNHLGLKSGDEILSINGQKITIWEDIEVFFQSQLSTIPEILTFEVRRAGKKEIIASQNLKKHIGNANSAIQIMDTLKLHNAELFVREVKPKAAAERAGLQPGDRIIGANKQKVYHFEGLRTLIQKAGEQNEKTVILEVERAGKVLQLSSELDFDKKKDPMGNTQTTYTIGIASMGEINIPLERVYNPAKALWLGTKETFHQTVTTVVGLKKLVMGEASMKSVGGPIMIAKIAGDAANRSWRQFFHIMAVISISLGVFNLLPVPILDGGHVVFAIIEAIRGKPVSQEATQWAMKVGMSLLLLLMVFAVYNDLSKVLPF